MPDLAQSLQGRDLGFLRIVAELWGIELNAPDARVGLQRLVAILLERKRVEEGIESLPGEARMALDDLLLNEGRLPWPMFTRRYGAVREMGPARRDRERPYLDSSAPSEKLWYRGLVGRAFFDTPAGPEEFAYIPEDLLSLIPAREAKSTQPLGRPASPSERAYLIPAGDRILDHACTLLAALRLGLPIENVPFIQKTSSPFPITPAALKALLSTAGLLDASGMPQPEPARAFLEASRGEALAMQVRAWMDSEDLNELRMVPGLSFEGDWKNNPRRARQAVLEFLATVPGLEAPAGEEAAWLMDISGGNFKPGGLNQASRGPGKRRPYWNLASFVTAICQVKADFQRPAGDYDSWYIRDTHSGDFLRGFEHWDAVDGALIRFIIAGPLNWLGVVDLAASAEGSFPSAFRYSEWAASLLNGIAPAGMQDENEAIQARSDGRVYVPRLAPRSARYQIARFGVWEEAKADLYQYRMTPGSLERARQQGLRVGHLLALLRRYAASVPPSLSRALERWEEHGSQARLERAMILRLGSSELMQALRNSRAARYLGDPLGPTAIIVKPEAWKKVMEVLAEMGYLVEAGESIDSLQI